MKVLSHLRPQVVSFLDPLQFAYHPQIGADDAVIYLMQRLHSHSDQSTTSLRITLFDLPRAFNTIHLWHLQNFPDDCVVVGCSRDGQGGECRDLVNSFVEWRVRNHLLLNVTQDQGDGGGGGGPRSAPLPSRVRTLNCYRHLGVLRTGSGGADSTS